MENNKVIRGAFRIAARGRREGGGSPVHEKLRGGLKCGQPLEPPPPLPSRYGWGWGKRGESSYHFTNHCTRSFRIERILIFANLAERQGEVKSRGYPPRDNHIKAPPSGSTFAFAPVSLHAGPKKERKRTPTKPAKPRPPSPPHLESTAAPEIIKGSQAPDGKRSPFASGLNAKTRASCF